MRRKRTMNLPSRQLAPDLKPFKMFYKTKFGYKQEKVERVQLVILGFGAIIEGLIMVLSLGGISTDIRAWLLFDRLWSGHEGNPRIFE